MTVAGHFDCLHAVFVSAILLWTLPCNFYRAAWNADAV